MRQPEERACASCGQPLPPQEHGHGRPVQYCADCRDRRRKLSSAKQRAGRQGKHLNGEDYVAFASEQIALAKQEFDHLPAIARAMLHHWISHAVAPADSLEPRDASHLKKDFSSEVRLVSVAAFCGAMIDAGYKPTILGDGRWLFPIRRGNDASFEGEPAFRYTIGHPTPRFNQLTIQLEEYINVFGPLTSENVEDDEDIDE